MQYIGLHRICLVSDIPSFFTSASLRIRLYTRAGPLFLPQSCLAIHLPLLPRILLTLAHTPTLHKAGSQRTILVGGRAGPRPTVTKNRCTCLSPLPFCSHLYSIRPTASSREPSRPVHLLLRMSSGCRTLYQQLPPQEGRVAWIRLTRPRPLFRGGLHYQSNKRSIAQQSCVSLPPQHYLRHRLYTSAVRRRQ